MAARIKMIHMRVERKGLAVIVGKNPVVAIGHLPLLGVTPREVSSDADKLLKIKNALILNSMKAFAETFGSPAIVPLEL
jgi:hypothetical protein